MASPERDDGPHNSNVVRKEPAHNGELQLTFGLSLDSLNVVGQYRGKLKF